MGDEFEIRSTQFPYDMSNWCIEKSKNVIEGLVYFLDWIDQQKLPDEYKDARRLLFGSAIYDATKLLAFSCGAKWSSEDSRIIEEDGLEGLEVVLSRYGLKISYGLIRKSRKADVFLKDMRVLIAGERSPSRTLIHQLLREYEINHPSFEKIKDLTEDVTMGNIEWEEYVRLVSVELTNMQEQSAE